MAQQISEDLLSYLTAVCNRASGDRAKKVLECQITPECLKTFYLNKKLGYSSRHSSRVCFEKGFRDERNGKQLHHAVLEKRCRQQWDALEALYGNEAKKNKTNFHDFLAKRTRKTTEKINVMAMTLTAQYKEYCQSLGIEEISLNKQGAIMRQLGYVKCDTTGHKVAYRGISIL